MLSLVLSRSFATKVAAGVTKNNKDSAGKRLGVKIFGGQAIGYNKILVRQRGFMYRPGYNVLIGRDHTLHSTVEGYVLHEYDDVRKKTVVSVVPWKLPVKPKLKVGFCYHPELFPERALENPAPGNYYVRPKTQKIQEKKSTDIGKALEKPKY